jgi:hypothetical protein
MTCSTGSVTNRRKDVIFMKRVEKAYTSEIFMNRVNRIQARASAVPCHLVWSGWILVELLVVEGIGVDCW